MKTALLMCGVLLTAVDVRGAVATAAGGDTAAAADSIDEIVVTARKRTESLREVPISAAVVTGATIAGQGIATLQDLTETLPAVTLAKGSTTDRLFIRGIGSGDNPSFEQSVGTFIDDIYHGRARSSEGSLFDIERVEVLKGPQTTYFGNNAIAGALNTITRDPSNEVAGYGLASYTPRFHDYVAEGAIDLPLASTVGLRLAAQHTGGDGWIDDLGAGERVPHTRNDAVRATALWKPNESFTARLKAQYLDDREEGGLPIVRADCPAAAAFGGASGFCQTAIAAGDGPTSADYTRRTSPGQGTRLTSQDYVGTLSLEQHDYKLDSVTGFSRYDYGLDTDLDLTPLNLLSIAAPEAYKQFSQELRITSTGTGPLDYVAGAYYQHSTLDAANEFDYGFLSPRVAAAPAFAPLLPYLPFGVNDRFNERDSTESVFGALTWKFSPRLRATGALRYTVVDKDFDQAIGVGTATANYGPIVALPASVAPLGAAFARGGGLATVGDISLTRRDDHLSPSFSAQFDATDNIMLYARYDNGFKAGGFNGVDLSGNAAALRFAPEKVDAVELGIKGRFFDNRATLDLDIFDSKYRDLQLAGVVPSSAGTYINRVENAGGATSRGVELDAGLRVTPTLRTGIAVTYLESYYTSFANATPTAQQTFQHLAVQDLSGQATPFAPRFSGDWTVEYRVPVSAALTFRVQNLLFVTDGMFLSFNNDPYDRQGGYAREDLTLGLASSSGWDLSLVGKNLTNRVIRTYGAALPTSLGSYVFITEPPSNATVQLKYTF